MTSTKRTESVERLIPAPAAAIFALLADPARHADIDGSGTVVKAKEPGRQVQLGDTFGMDMKLGGKYSMVNTIVEFEQDRRIAWQARPTAFMKVAIGGRIWRYELEPRDGGTLVRETWDITHEKLPWLVAPARKKTNEAMTKTLEKIEQLVT